MSAIGYEFLAQRTSELRKLGFRKIAAVSWHVPDELASNLGFFREAGISTLINLHLEQPRVNLDGLQWVLRSDAPERVTEFDALIIVDPVFDAVYHAVGRFPLMRRIVMERDVAIVPLHPEHLRQSWLATPDIQVQSTYDPSHYGLWSKFEGHYVEFGTWYGSSLILNSKFFSFLKGKFYSFDSYGGLSKGTEAELQYTAFEDYEEGRYFANVGSVKANLQLAGRDINRFKFIPGYYENSVRGKSISEYGLTEKSVSVLCIDCDLYEPTLDALRFITPALEDGALIYFDDFRMARCLPKAGEYDAMRTWLKENPEIELVDFLRSSWMSQWFIVTRR